MHTINTKDVVNAYLSAFAQQDYEEALRYVTEDAVWHVDGDPILSTVGIIQGKSAIRRWLEHFLHGFEPLEFHLEPLISEGEDVLAIGHFRHRIVTTSAIVDGHFVIRFTIKNNQISHYQIFEDSLGLSHAHYGVSPERRQRINGVIYEYEDHGHGEVRMCLHGLDHDGSFWSPVLADLCRDGRCVVFDLPSHEKSRGNQELDDTVIANDIALWMVENAVDKATLIGHQRGASIALNIANNAPHLVTKLVLVSPIGDPQLAKYEPKSDQRPPKMIEVEAIVLSPHNDYNTPQLTSLTYARYSTFDTHEGPLTQAPRAMVEHI
ncbi:alpha/beta fold hydrolase [Vibrio ostreicida]|uniref:alpha/beta fold hydrolase n=1 Tax=Vibrio ostreicida TaxID=526588 RepID=UPI003B5CFC74